MRNDARPDPAALAKLATCGDIRDRAFVASTLRLWFDQEPSSRVECAELYEGVRQRAKLEHASVRRLIARRELDRAGFVERLLAEPLETRDHFVEEILDLAYPPLETSTMPKDALVRVPSGLGEILFLIENAELGPSKTFVDLGSGEGKVVLLVALLTGARAIGIELDANLVEHGRDAARSLVLENVELRVGDLHDTPIPEADVYYMYIPFLGSAELVARLEPHARARPIRLFSQALAGCPWLERQNRASYWLEMYEGNLTGRDLTGRRRTR